MNLSTELNAVADESSNIKMIKRFRSSSPVVSKRSHSSSPAKGVQCRNASTLALRNILRGDGTIDFEECSHKYTVCGDPVSRSTTALLTDCFEQFDPIECFQKFYNGWKNNTQSKYFDVIQRVLASGGDDGDAKRSIQVGWAAEGEKASRLGTKLHAYCEFRENDEYVAPDNEISAEISQFEAFKDSDWARSRGLECVRTELCVSYRVDGVNVCAGQIDALYQDNSGRFYIFDFKRVVKKHLLTAEEEGFRGKMGIGPAALLPDTNMMHYSLQTAAYNVMLRQTHAVDVEDRMFLLRMHSDRNEYQLVQCVDLRKQAMEMLESERASILATNEDLAMLHS